MIHRLFVAVMFFAGMCAPVYGGLDEDLPVFDAVDSAKRSFKIKQGSTVWIENGLEGFTVEGFQEDRGVLIKSTLNQKTYVYSINDLFFENYEHPNRPNFSSGEIVHYHAKVGVIRGVSLNGRIMLTLARPYFEGAIIFNEKVSFYLHQNSKVIAVDDGSLVLAAGLTFEPMVRVQESEESEAESQELEVPKVKPKKKNSPCLIL